MIKDGYDMYNILLLFNASLNFDGKNYVPEPGNGNYRSDTIKEFVPGSSEVKHRRLGSYKNDGIFKLLDIDYVCEDCDYAGTVSYIYYKLFYGAKLNILDYACSIRYTSNRVKVLLIKRRGFVIVAYSVSGSNVRKYYKRNAKPEVINLLKRLEEFLYTSGYINMDKLVSRVTSSVPYDYHCVVRCKEDYKCYISEGTLSVRCKDKEIRYDEYDVHENRELLYLLFCKTCVERDK